MKTKTVKSVDWSYPSSSNAARFGFPSVGCWTLSVTTIGERTAKTLAQSGHATQGEAYDAAKLLPHPWASWVRMATDARKGDNWTPYAAYVNS